MTRLSAALLRICVVLVACAMLLSAPGTIVFGTAQAADEGESMLRIGFLMLGMAPMTKK